MAGRKFGPLADGASALLGAGLGIVFAILLLFVGVDADIEVFAAALIVDEGAADADLAGDAAVIEAAGDVALDLAGAGGGVLVFAVRIFAFIGIARLMIGALGGAGRAEVRMSAVKADGADVGLVADRGVVEDGLFVALQDSGSSPAQAETLKERPREEGEARERRGGLHGWDLIQAGRLMS